MSEFIEIKAALTVDDAGEITGVAWPFGTPDRVGDVITKGAFASTPARLPMLWSHDQSAVIGVWESIDETPAGLQVKGRLLLRVEKASEVRELITAGAVNGLSIGFKTKQATPRRGGGRTISALDLVEISVVAVPSHPDARILSAKSATHTKGKIMENDNIEDVEIKTVDTEAIEEKFTSLETKLADLGGLGSRLDRIEARLNRPGAPAIITKQADPDIERKAFENWMRKGHERMDPVERKALETKALSVAVGTAGGYLVPPSWESEITRNLVLHSPIRSVARVTQTSAAKVTVPKRTAVTNAVWAGETAQRTESDPAFGSQIITVHELATFTDISNQLLEDNAYNLEQELSLAFAEDFAKKEGAAFVNGTGDANNQPVGLMTNTSIPVVNAAAATYAPDDLIAAFHALASVYAANAVWMMNRNVIAKVRSMKTSTGEYLWQPGQTDAGLVQGNAGILLGRPVIETPDLPDQAPLTKSIVFADMKSCYRIYDRVNVEILKNPYSLADQGMTRFHARRRVGSDVVRPEAAVFLKTTA